MPHAQDDLDKGISLVEALISLEAQYSDPPDIAFQSTVMALRGGSLVLTVATFENYLKVRIQEAVKYLSIHASDHREYDFELLSQEIRLNHFYLTLEHAMKGNGYDQKKKVDRLLDIRKAVIDVAANRLDHIAFAQTGGNPNPDTVKRMLKNIGISDPFGKLIPIYEVIHGNSVAIGYIEGKLETLIRQRNIVSHTANILSIGRLDIVEYKNFARNLALSIDKLLNDHCEATVAAIRIP